MTSKQGPFLSGVPEDLVRAALDKAGGNELKSGKFESPESSAALAANTFGWFIRRPAELPPFPSLPDVDWPADAVQVERQMRFPWRGGRHPWLDASVETATHVIGVESKRFEPFRDVKTVHLPPAYDGGTRGWGENMAPFASMRDALRSGAQRFRYLDGAQLVKHAFGLVTEGGRLGKRPVLVYLYAEPSRRGSTPISPQAIELHRAEIARFAAAVSGAEVRFAACAYGEWLREWTGDAAAHAQALRVEFGI